MRDLLYRATDDGRTASAVTDITSTHISRARSATCRGERDDAPQQYQHQTSHLTREEETMASERVLDVMVRRHVLDTDRPFARVLDGIFSGISQPDIAQLFSKLAASTTYQQFSSLVEQAQGSAGLMRFLQLDLDHALSIDPEAQDWSGRRLVRLIVGNPVTMGQMTRHVPDAGSYAPVTILIEETRGGGARVAYDSVASAIAPYRNAAASEVARRLDAEVLGLLRESTGVQAPAAP